MAGLKFLIAVPLDGSTTLISIFFPMTDFWDLFSIVAVLSLTIT